MATGLSWEGAQTRVVGSVLTLLKGKEASALCSHEVVR